MLSSQLAAINRDSTEAPLFSPSLSLSLPLSPTLPHPLPLSLPRADSKKIPSSTTFSAPDVSDFPKMYYLNTRIFEWPIATDALMFIAIRFAIHTE